MKLVAVSVRMQVVAISAFASRLKISIVIGQNVALGTRALFVKLKTLTGGSEKVHPLKRNIAVKRGKSDLTSSFLPDCRHSYSSHIRFRDPGPSACPPDRGLLCIPDFTKKCIDH